MAKIKIGNILNCIFNRGALSTIWSSTAAYTAGQYVAYGNFFYKCIKNASAGTVPTNTTYWVKTDLASEITSLNSNLVTRKHAHAKSTTAGLYVPNNVYVTADLLSILKNGHGLAHIFVEGICLTNGTSETEFGWLNADNIIGLVQADLGFNKHINSEATYPIYQNGLIDSSLEDQGFYICTHPDGRINIGRYFDGGNGEWPNSKLKKNGKYFFSFYAELY